MLYNPWDIAKEALGIVEIFVIGFVVFAVALIALILLLQGTARLMGRLTGQDRSASHYYSSPAPHPMMEVTYYDVSRRTAEPVAPAHDAPPAPPHGLLG